MSRGNRTVLVVEDDPDIRASLKDLLELEGYKVYAAANGAEGFEVLESLAGPCLILLDLMMPTMNGWKFLEKKRKEAIFVDIPVVVISAVNLGRAPADAVGFIKKPIDVHRLLDALTKYCP